VSPPGPLAALARRLYADAYLKWLTVALVVAAGLSTLATIPRIEDPRIATRNALVTTSLPGATAARVEAQVTEKLEANLETLPEIKRIESTSRAGLSVISVELLASIDETTNEAAFSRIRDKLRDAEPELPRGAGKPRFDDKRGAVAYGMIVAVSDERSGEPDMNLVARAAEALADRLQRVPGTEIVRLHGAPDEEITVAVEPARLATLRLPIAEVATRIRAADARQVAGVYRGARHDLALEVDGALDAAARIRDVPLKVAPDGARLSVGDVADVTRGVRTPPQELGLVDGRRAVFVAARPIGDVRLDLWSRDTRAAIEGFDGAFGDAVETRILFDQNTYTRARLSNLGSNLGAGALVVVAVVAVTMGLKASLVVGSALPLSAALALFGLTLFDEQLHQMTIFGMIVAVGLLIDNAIVMTDEVVGRLETGARPDDAIGGAVALMSGPLAASTVTTILGFMPVFLLPGNVGDFVGPIAVSVVLALAASFFVALTLIPAFAAGALGDAARPARRRWWHHGVAVPGLVARFERLLAAALVRPRRVVAALAALALTGFAAAATLGNEFFPPAERDQFQIEVLMASETPLERTAHIARELSATLHAEPGVERVFFEVGGSVPTVYYNLLMDEQARSRYAQAVVDCVDAATAEALVARIRAPLAERFPDAQIVVGAFGQGPPTDAPVGFRVVGPDLDVLVELGQAVRRVMRAVPGVTETRASLESGEPKLWFEADETAAAQTGLSLTGIAERLYVALEGVEAGSVFEDVEELPVRVRASEATRSSLTSIAGLTLVSAPGAGAVPAAALGEFDLRPEYAQITRRDGERVNRIDGFIDASVLPIDVTRAVTARLEEAGFAPPPGYRLEAAGDSEGQSEAVGSLTTYLPLIGLLMVATVVLTFRSLALAGIVGAVAIASVGFGMAALAVSRYPIGFNPLIGTAGLVGVAINGTIVVLANLRADAAARRGEIPAIVASVRSTGRHIVSTTLTTVGGFGPLFVFVGGDFWPPLAVVIAGGVACSVVLSLVFTPCAFVLVTARGARRAPEGQAA